MTTLAPTLKFPAAQQAGPDPHVLLAELTALHDQLKRLVELAERKLHALRSANAFELQRCAGEEDELVAALYGKTPGAGAVLAGLAQRLRDAAGEAGRLSDLARNFAPPISSQIQARIAGLRELARKLEEKNRLVASVARGLHGAMRAVLEDVREARRETVGYQASGRSASRAKESWIDAVG